MGKILYLRKGTALTAPSASVQAAEASAVALAEDQETENDTPKEVE